ncbi:MAG: TIGR03943 family protein [Synergistaceae bacterium]|nr:TIGR03943 family protein [Synergistaceae bacterium]
MRLRNFNPQALLESACSSAFGALLIHLVSSGGYLSYVTPRMKPYLYFTAAVMCLWAAAGAGEIFRPRRRVRAAHCLVLLIPALLLLLPHSSLSSLGASGMYGGFAGRQGTQVVPAQDGYGAESDITGDDESYGADIFGSYPDELEGFDAAGRKITVADEDFGRWINEIYMNMDKYDGCKVELTGFVVKNPEFFAPDEFVPARLAMSCCAADLEPVGLVCKYDRASELEPESWVTVEGILSSALYEFEGEMYSDPQITVTGITPAKPADSFVYLY